LQFLDHNNQFPNVNKASEYGLLAVGGDLSPERLLSAYDKGIFPWFEDDKQILWWSPDPRFVLFPNELKVSKSMKQFLRNCDLKVTVNQNFREVITECARAKRNGQVDTWITKGMIEAYVKLHELGYALSVEVWQKNKLVGGFYGVDLKKGVFFGESMFSKVSNASKAGFITFIQNNNYKLIDCQDYTNHLKSLGARDISRNEFLKYLV
jgi:leucyl/phenylalanyl-tRNA--protein transferase